MSDADLFRWAQTHMIWERQIAKERGEELPRIRHIRNLRSSVHNVLSQSVIAPATRGKLAAHRIEVAIRRAYGLGIE